MDQTIAKEAIGLAKLINDPVLIVLITIILSFLVYFFYYAKVQSKKDERNFEIIRVLTEEINHNSQTLVKLTTLIEILVHGGAKSKRN